MLNRRHLLEATAIAALGLGSAHAQTTFPSKPLRIVVPFGPGGVADLTARAVAQQLSVNFGGQSVLIDNRPGAGGILAAELQRTQANLIAQIIPYNGTPAVINALRGGQVDVVVEILGPLKPQISAKAVRLLGVMGANRPKDQPQVPVVRELPGLSNFNVSSWNALAAPGKTPQAVVTRLNTEVTKVLTDPAMVQRLAGFNVQAQSSTSSQLAQLLETDIKRWSEVIQKAGITQQ
jgi:tripartite-type tricarboxylate transporter receptor subunit TctC